MIYNNILFPGENKYNGDDIEPLLDEAAGDMSVNLVDLVYLVNLIILVILLVMVNLVSLDFGDSGELPYLK